MKRQGKITSRIREETKRNRNPDVPRASMIQGKMASKEEMDEHIKQRVNEIHEKYSLDCCLLIVGDLDKIPKSLRELYCDAVEKDGLSVVNLDFNYRQYKSGQLDAYDFLCALDALLTTLLSEFAEITEMFITGTIEEKENYNERT